MPQLLIFDALTLKIHEKNVAIYAKLWGGWICGWLYSVTAKRITLDTSAK